MLFVILKGGIDLSVGSTVGLSGVVAGTLLQGWQLNLFDVVALPARSGSSWLVSLAVGLLVGFVNGFLITRFNVAPFIATLGMLYIARGAALLIIERHDLPTARRQEDWATPGFLLIGGGRILGIPTAIWIMVVFAIVAAFVLTQDAVRPVGLRRGRQRAGRGALGRAGAQRQAARLHDQRLLRGDDGTHHHAPS